MSIDLLGPLAGVIKRRKMVEALKSVKWFTHLSEQEINRLADVVNIETPSSGRTLFRHGDMCDNFYIICGGTVQQMQKKRNGPPSSSNEVEHDNDNEDDDISSRNVLLTTGHYFGEGALLGRSFRSMTFVVDTDASLYVISKKSLSSMLGNAMEARIRMGIIMCSLSLMPPFHHYPRKILRRAAFAFQSVSFTTGQCIARRNDAVRDKINVCVCFGYQPLKLDVSFSCVCV